MTSPRFAAWTILAALAAAGAAQAETAPLKLDLAAARSSTSLDLDAAPASSGFTDAQAEALRTGVARTAVDHRFADRLTGSLGFLCGLHPSEGHEGAAAMRGYDPQGKFLGAKLSFAFR